MNKRILGIIIFFVVTTACTITSTPSSASNDGPVVTTSDGSLQGAVVTIDGYSYNCIKYSTVDRGGLWCDKR